MDRHGRHADWTTYAVRVALPLRSWRHPAAGAAEMILIELLKRHLLCGIAGCAGRGCERGGERGGSYGQRIERAEGFAQGMNRYPTLARAEIPTQVHIFRFSY